MAELGESTTGSPLALLGTWRLDRVIEDRTQDRTIRLHGTTTLTLESDGRVRWDDEGVLELPTGPLPGRRTSYVEPRDDGWFVTFEDGRDFHPWRPGSTVEHPCGDDLYRGEVVVLDPDRMRVVWDVRGPTKSYRLTSVLSRAFPSPG